MLSQLVNHIELFENSFKYIFRLNKKIESGIVTAYFIFPPMFLVNEAEIEKYGKILDITTGNGVGVKVEFQSKELSDYFWNNWTFDYKFEV